MDVAIQIGEKTELNFCDDSVLKTYKRLPHGEGDKWLLNLVWFTIKKKALPIQKYYFTQYITIVQQWLWLFK